MNWDQYFMGIAQAAKLRSKDPRTQVGALIVSPDRRRTVIGYNGMPEGMDETDCWHDDCKDDLVIHAEVNAVANAARTGVEVNGGTVYVTLPPCLACTRIVVAAGLSKVVFPQSAYMNWVMSKPKWKDKFQQSFDYMDRADVEWCML